MAHEMGYIVRGLTFLGQMLRLRSMNPICTVGSSEICAAVAVGFAVVAKNRCTDSLPQHHFLRSNLTLLPAALHNCFAARSTGAQSVSFFVRMFAERFSTEALDIDTLDILSR